MSGELMHFEILVEDQSGRVMLEQVVPKLIDPRHTVRFHHYRGIGQLPRGEKPRTQAAKRILLDQLPRLLRGFGRAFAGYGRDFSGCVVVVMDADDRDPTAFAEELAALLNQCQPKPEARFPIAIEEGEAWLLGDRQAVMAAYPRAKQQVLDRYAQDSVCGTWEVLADALHPEGSAGLRALGYRAVGIEKTAWAKAIAPRLQPERNASPSFKNFCATVRELAGPEDSPSP
jgi:hypothetical protein